jgi:hypothetical protein
VTYPTMTKLPAHVVAGETGRWTEILFRALSNRVAKRWQFVSFRGKNKGEWRGIVDVLAIRKDTSQPAGKSLKRGDLFDIILIQMKGGSARRPSVEEKVRLRGVADHYGAKEVVLFEWKRGKVTAFYTLDQSLYWVPTASGRLFG